MKKKGILIIGIIVLVVAIIIVNKKIKLSKIEYEVEEVKTYNYFKYVEKEKVGVIDRDGNIIIEAKYNYINIPNPEKDVFICSNDEEEKNVILNSKNEELLTQYENIESINLKSVATLLCYERSVLKYKKDGLYGLISYDGKEITKNIYSSIENLQSTEGKLLVCKDDKYGIINIKGTVIIDTKYDKIEADGYYLEEDNNVKSGYIVSNKTEDGYRYGYVDYTGKEILTLKYGGIERISDIKDILLIVEENGKYGLFKGNKELIKPQYQLIEYNDNDCLTIQKNRTYGIADLTGNIRIEPKYTKLTAKGIYIYVEKENEKQVFDINGNKVDINFDKIVYKTENDEYRVTTLLNNNITYYGVENKSGVTLINNSYRYLEYLYKDYFIAKNNEGNIGIINANGKVIIDLKYDIVQKIKGKNVVQFLNTETKENEIYSKDLKLVATMKNAIIDNENHYIKIYNDKEAIYLNSDGEILKEDSSIVKDNEGLTLPNNIGEFEKKQYSLNSVYYIKK